MLWPILSSILFLASAIWAGRCALSERSPQIHIAFVAMLIAGIACGQAWENLWS